MSKINKMSNYCSKHGNIGDPQCQECWDILEKMCKDKNVHLIYDKKDRKIIKK